MEEEKKQNVIFLGAGASKSEGAPLQGELFKEFFVGFNQNRFDNYSNEYEGVGSPEKLNDIYFKLLEFLSNTFRIKNNIDSLRQNIYPTFEEVLGILEFASKRQESFKGYNIGADDSDLQRIREYLIFLIALVLDESLKHGHGNHKKLLSRLDEEGTLSKTNFISFNYDLLIDQAIIDLNDKFDLDYGIEFTNYFRPGDWVRPRPERSLLLYKLHGSLNWLFCPTCSSITLYPGEKKVAQLVFRPQYCTTCNTKMMPIIIPPTFFKEMSNYFLQQIWMKTELVLRQSKRIFFCGYSFPEADIHIKYILKRAETFRNSNFEIYVINNNPDKLIRITEKKIKKEIEEKRFKRFFKNGNNIKFINKSFELFCKEGI